WTSVSVSTCFILGACSSMGPGMQFGNTVGASGNGSNGNGVIPTTLKPITPQLVREEKELREQQASQDLSLLMAPIAPYKIESGDILTIVVWDHPELASSAVSSASSTSLGTTEATPGSTPVPGFVIDHQGLVQFP